MGLLWSNEGRWRDIVLILKTFVGRVRVRVPQRTWLPRRVKLVGRHFQGKRERVLTACDM